MVVLRLRRIRSEIKRRGWTHAEFAGRCGLSERSVYRIFQGAPLQHTTQVKVHRAFGGEVPPKALFEVVVDKPSK
jgi:transcriptional regulator with XRE-family HTH domain